MPSDINNRMRYTRQAIVSNTFYQMPRFLTAGEFAGNKITNNARILYTLLLDRHKLSIKNGWFDDSGEVYIYFKREEMENQLGLSERTISKVMQELKDFLLVEEKQQGLNKPNKIYLLSPVIGNDENLTPYLDPDTDYNPEKGDYECYAESCITEPVNTAVSDTQNLRPLTHKYYASEPVENINPGGVNSTVQDPQELSPNNNKLINNKKNNNYMSNIELSKTAAANNGKIETEPPAAAEAAAVNSKQADSSVPFSQILEMYNGLCETNGLRSIRSISGKRKTQTAARFKEYGLSGFIDLFDKVSASVFLCGGGDRGWKADFDWLIASTNMQKVLEGKYNNDQSNIPLQQQQMYEAHGAAIYSNPPQNKQERRDPFLERAMAAYARAEQAITVNTTTV